MMFSGLLRHKKSLQSAAGYVVAGSALSMISLNLLNRNLSSVSADGLDPQNFTSFKVTQVEAVSHNTKRVRFQLQTPQATSGMTVASCLVAKAPIGENKADVFRPYTPVTLADTKGYFDLLVKEYPTGLMSRHICSLKKGDSLEMKGPFLKLEIKPNMKKTIGMIAGGTGITPMFQVIQELLKNSQDKTELRLVFCNQTEEDILLNKELEALTKAHPRFKVHHVIAKPSKNWKGSSGYITKDIIKAQMPAPSNDSLILVCGPPGLMEAVSGDKNPDKSQGPLKGYLLALAYKEDHVFKF